MSKADATITEILEQAIQFEVEAHDFYMGALDLVKQLSGNKNKILFVGTKRQAQEVIAEEAQRAKQPYVNHRWLGGMLTNFQTIRQRIKRLKELEAMARREIGDGVAFDAVVLQGQPAHEIAACAADQRADLIIISTHGRTGLRHVLVGSVAENVVRYAPCPVLVVR